MTRAVDSATRQRGAALLTALIIVSVVATIAAAMVWQQWRAVQVESAERARTQSAWILSGALDWARLILREDLRASSTIDHLGEPWAVPLAEARLSTFLAAEAQVADDAPDAFLSGAITDAQGKLNLNMLVGGGRVPSEPWTLALQTLCTNVGVSADVALRIRAGLIATTPLPAAAASGASAPAPAAADLAGERPLQPQSVEQLAWLGIEPEAVRALTPYVTLLPTTTAVNVNTAPRELLAAVLGIDMATAERLVQVRQRTPFKNADELRQQLVNPQTDLSLATYRSDWFEVRGRLRLDSVVLEQKSLVRRPPSGPVIVIRRERVSSQDTALMQPVEK